MSHHPITRAFVVALMAVLPWPFVAGFETRAQQAQAAQPVSDETARLASGWAMLASGRIGEAAALGTQLAGQYPRDVAVLVFAVEAEIARAGSSAGLAEYEQWMTRHPVDEFGVLRRIAHALLEEISRQPQNPTARLEALRLLAADGDATAAQMLADAARSGRPGETRALATLGNEKAVQALIDALKTGAQDKLSTIQALGASGSPLAAEPLVAVLQDPRPELRGEAADALGHIDAPGVAEHLRAALRDPSPFVRVKAAAGLYRLGDQSGTSLLQKLATADAATDRLTAAQALSVRPDGNWLALVRQLTEASEPDVRLGAARLLATQDPAAAQAVFERLATDPNLTIREDASRAAAATLPGDFTRLRALLRNTDRLTRVQAAGRILELTR
jgi:HEAT repeat protein